MNSIKFSVTIPAYKGKYLNEAISSVLAQTYNNFELVIVDDCSPEDLKSIVSQYHDPRIRYYRNDQNCGAINVVDNWNICLSYCLGDYVICMGDDDRLKPSCLDNYVNLINKYPYLQVYHAWTDIIDENGACLKSLEKRSEYESVFSLIYRRMNGDSQFIGDFCYDVRALKSYSGYYKLPLAWCSDDISAFRAACNGGIANTQEICFEYRVSSITISKNESKETIDIKVNALLEEKVWLEKMMKTFSDKDMSVTDSGYYTYINKNITKYISEEIAYWAMKDIHAQWFRIQYWLRYFYDNNLSLKVFLIKYLSYLYHKVV